jgi:Replication initiator protein A
MEGEKTARISRDEMNLAEFPLTVLSTRTDPHIKTLEFRDTITGKNGEVIAREWIITGADKFGLPTSSDDEVLLGLLKLTVDDGMQQRKVYFTRYELLKILRWSTEGRSYNRLQKALDRLSGVRIKATNAFYDNDLKTHRTKNFGLIDSYEINSGRDGDIKSSFFQWSEVLFKSFQVGFIKKLDLDFYLNLRSAVSKRLYRFLDKHFWYKSKVSCNVFVLAHEKIGISRNYKYASSLRQQLDPALEELQETGYLDSFSYSGRGKNCNVTMCAPSSRSVKKERSIRDIKEDLVKTVSSTPEGSLIHETVEALVERGLHERQALKLIVGRSEDVLKRVKDIIQYYDSLCKSGSKLVARSPVGFLYRAVENPLQFKLPQEAPQQVELLPRESARKQADQPPKAHEREALFLIERQRKIKQTLSTMPPSMVESLRAEVELALVKLRPLITPQRFAEAVQHGIEEKIARQVGITDIKEWLSSSEGGSSS